MADNFFALYRHPEWQKKRLEVMKAANFRCQECDDSEETLNVHHRFYVKGRKPWEYEDSDLICLCETCHERFHDGKFFLNYLVGKLDLSDSDQVRGYALGLLMAANADSYTENEQQEVRSAEFAEGIADAYGISGTSAVEDVINSLIGPSRDRITHVILNRLRKQQRTGVFHRA